MHTFRKAVFGICILTVTLQSNAQWTNISNSFSGSYSSVLANAACNDSIFIGLFQFEDNAVFTQKLLMTSNIGNSWKEVPGTDTLGVQVREISIIDTLNIWAIGSDDQSIFRTSDGGQSWQRQFHDTTITNFINAIEMFDLLNGVAMGDGEESGAPVILTTVDGGNNWTVTISSQQIGGKAGWGADQIDFIDIHTGYFSPDNDEYSIYKTDDGGATWTKTAFVSGSNSVRLLKFGDESIGFASTSSELQRTLDGGVTWHSYTYNEAYTRWDIQFVPGSSTEVWLVGDEWLYYSNDSGTTFYPVEITGFGLSNTNEGRGLVIASARNGMLFSQTAVYRTMDGAGSTSVQEQQYAATPPDFTLHQNYPNPFNQDTRIEYELDRVSRVSLRIYNVRGDRIRDLNRGEIVGPGNHHAMWDGRDDEGKTVPSGIYLYTLKTDDLKMTRSLLLLK